MAGPTRPPTFNNPNFLAAASQGPGVLAYALGKYQQTLVQNTRAMETLARAAESAGGQSYLTRAAALGYQGDAALSQLRVAEAQARRLSMQTPAYHEALGARVDAEAAEGMNQLKARKDYANAQSASPQARPLAAARVETNAAESMNALRTRAMEAAAGAARAATPQGRAEARERAELNKDVAAAQIRQAQQENIAKYGQLGGSLVNARDGAMKMAAAAGPWVAAATAAASAAYGLAAAASPSSASTFNSSWELLFAKMGHQITPALDETSKAVQRAGNAWDRAMQTRIGNHTAGDYAGAAAMAALAGGPQIYNWFTGNKEDMSRNIDLPLSARSFGGGQVGQFGIALQQASLQSGAQQTQLQVLQEQLKELQHSGSLLTQLVGNSNAAANAVPSFA